MSAINVTFDDHGFMYSDDQLLLSKAFLDNAKTAHPIITLDYNADVFASLYDIQQAGSHDFTPIDWECVEGKGFTFKLTGAVPKVFHASGRQGLPWMQREVLPYSLCSGKLGKPAPCGQHAESELTCWQSTE
jgi:hypothetical protein